MEYTTRSSGNVRLLSKVRDTVRLQCPIRPIGEGVENLATQREHQGTDEQWPCSPQVVQWPRFP